MIAQIENLNKDCVKIQIFDILYTFQEISRQRALRSGRFIVLNDSASPKIIITSIEHRIKNPVRRTSEHIAITYFQTFT